MRLLKRHTCRLAGTHCTNQMPDKCQLLIDKHTHVLMLDSYPYPEPGDQFGCSPIKQTPWKCPFNLFPFICNFLIWFLQTLVGHLISIRKQQIQNTPLSQFIQEDMYKKKWNVKNAVEMMSKQLFFVTCSSQQDAVDYKFTGHMPCLFSLCSREVKEMLIYEEVLKSSGLQNNFSLKLLRSVRWVLRSCWQYGGACLCQKE